MKPIHQILTREFKGLLDRIDQWIEYAARIRELEAQLAEVFADKRVAIIGNSPGLIGKGLGKEIDAHDLVVRINGGARIQAPDDIGHKTDVMFLGATMEKEKDFISLNQNNAGCVAISTTKNRAILGMLPISRSVFYPRILPRVITKKTQQAFKIPDAARKFRPPRSGFICLAAIHRYGKAREISLYGMSDSIEKSQGRVTPTGEVKTYDPQQYKGLHCDPAFELTLLKQLTEHAENITWRGRD